MSISGEERKRIILEQLNVHRKVKVDDLASQFRVSTETVRKYLNELEALNKLKKVYGGAVKIAYEEGELPYKVREIANISAKRAIALEASRLIEDNDIIALDEGSTPLQMIEYIVCKKNLTVVTCSLPMLSALCDLVLRGVFDGRIIFMGGIVSAKHLRVSGTITEAFMDSIYVNKAFISVDGVSADGCVSSFDADKSLLSRKMMMNAQYKYVLCDHSKLKVRTFYKICDVQELTGIICDTEPDETWIDNLEKYNILWISPSE